MSKRPASALDEAVKVAVRDGLREYLPEILPKLIADVPAVVPSAREPILLDGPRYVGISEMCKRLSLGRSAVLRRERMGVLPKRRRWPDNRLGWDASDLAEWAAQSTLGVGAEGAEPSRLRTARLRKQ